MHAISSYRGNRPTHTQTNKSLTHRQDQLQYTAPLSLACSVTITCILFIKIVMPIASKHSTLITAQEHLVQLNLLHLLRHHILTCTMQSIRLWCDHHLMCVYICMFYPCVFCSVFKFYANKCVQLERCHYFPTICIPLSPFRLQPAVCIGNIDIYISSALLLSLLSSVSRRVTLLMGPLEEHPVKISAASIPFPLCLLKYLLVT